MCRGGPIGQGGEEKTEEKRGETDKKAKEIQTEERQIEGEG